MRRIGRRIFYKGSICEDGVEVLRYRIELEGDGERSLEELLEELATRAECFCRDVLAGQAKQRYAESDAPDKRFRHAPLIYGLVGRTEQKNGARRLVIEATLRVRGQTEPLRHIKREYKHYETP